MISTNHFQTLSHLYSKYLGNHPLGSLLSRFTSALLEADTPQHFPGISIKTFVKIHFHHQVPSRACVPAALDFALFLNTITCYNYSVICVKCLLMSKVLPSSLNSNTSELKNKHFSGGYRMTKSYSSQSSWQQMMAQKDWEKTKQN